MISAEPIAVTELRAYYEALKKAYGPQSWWPSDSPFETVIGAYLTQNTAWRYVERSIANLRAAGALEVDGFRALSTEQLRELIRPSGYMIRKSLALQAFVRFLDEQCQGSMEQLAGQDTKEAREKLLSLPGVGPETADAILLYALGHPVMVADEYMRRVVTRHRLANPRVRYDELKSLGESVFASEQDRSEQRAHLNELHALIVQAGKSHCRRVAQCLGCPLEPFLPAGAPPPTGVNDPAVKISPASIARGTKTHARPRLPKQMKVPK